jgi:hypothetical protein
MQVMFEYYLPAKGDYTVSVGLFGSELAFSGPLRVVDAFTTLSGPTPAIKVDVAQQALQMEQQFNARVDADARTTGATPIRVQLPINGRLFRLEKILALPQDKLWFEVKYKGWESAR